MINGMYEFIICDSENIEPLIAYQYPRFIDFVILPIIR